MAKTESVSPQDSNRISDEKTNVYGDLTSTFARLRISLADYGLLLMLGLIALLSAFVVILFLPVFEPGIPKGYSTLIHFFKVFDIRQSFAQFGTYIDWSESWYGGHHQFLLYPPLFYFLAAAVDFIIDDLMLTSKLMMVAGVIVATVTSYLLTYAVFPHSSKFWHRALAAMGGALIFGLNPSLITFITRRGKYPDYWAIAIAPISMIFLVNWLKFKRDKIPYGFAVMTAVVFLTHIDMGVTLLIISVIFSYVYLKVDLKDRGRIFDKAMNRPLMRLGISLFAFVGISTFFWFPYLSYIGEIGALKQLFPSRHPMPLFSYFRGNFYQSLTRYPGYISILLALLVFAPPFKKYKAEIYSWTAVLITGIVLLMIQYTSLAESMPEIHTLFFRTAMVTIVMALAVLAGLFCLSLLEEDWKGLLKKYRSLLAVKRLVPFINISIIILLLLVIYHDGSYVFSPERLKPVSSFSEKTEFSQVRKLLKDAKVRDTGMVLAINTPTPEVTYLPVIIGKPMVNGYEAQTSRAADDLDILRTTLLKKKSSQAALLKRLDRWGVEYIFINKEKYEKEFQNLESIDRLTPIFKGSRYQVYEYEGKGYVMPEKTVLTIGSEFTYTDQVLGKATDLGLIKEKSILIDSYELKDLLSHEIIILNGVEINDIDKNKRKLKEYVASGGRLFVVTDNGFTNLFSGDSFLGANVIRHKFAPGTMKISDKYMGDNYDIKNDSEWSGTYFEGQVESIATFNGKTVIGKRTIGDGEVIFIGYNLIYHAASTENRNEYALLQDLIGGSKREELAKIDYTIEQRVPGIKRINVSSSKATWALLPMSWSPYWQVFVDDVRVNTKSLGNMIAFHLPKGDHDVILKFKKTPLHVGAILFSLFTLLLIMFTPQIRRRIHSRSRIWE